MNVTDQKFGIEIEFIGANRHEVSRLVNANNVECKVEDYNHTTRDHWKIVTDASVYNGYEIVSPILQGENGLLQVAKVCEALNEAGARVDVSCGLHVHLDASEMTMAEIKSVYTRYAKFEEQIDLCMPRSRRNSRWCASIKRNVTAIHQTSEKAEAGRAVGRYFKLNLCNLGRSGSIEFRQHSGTTDFGKISNWILFLMQFVQRSCELTHQVRRPTTNSASAFKSLRKSLTKVGWELEFISGQRWVLKSLIDESTRSISTDQIRAWHRAIQSNLAQSPLRGEQRLGNMDAKKFRSKANIISEAKAKQFVNVWFGQDATFLSGVIADVQNDEWLDGVDQEVVTHLENRRRSLA